MEWHKSWPVGSSVPWDRYLRRSHWWGSSKWLLRCSSNLLIQKQMLNSGIIYRWNILLWKELSLRTCYLVGILQWRYRDQLHHNNVLPDMKWGLRIPPDRRCRLDTCHQYSGRDSHRWSPCHCQALLAGWPRNRRYSTSHLHTCQQAEPAQGWGNILLGDISGRGWNPELQWCCYKCHLDMDIDRQTLWTLGSNTLQRKEFIFLLIFHCSFN